MPLQAKCSRYCTLCGMIYSWTWREPYFRCDRYNCIACYMWTIEGIVFFLVHNVSASGIPDMSYLNYIDSCILFYFLFQFFVCLFWKTQKHKAKQNKNTRDLVKWFGTQTCNFNLVGTLASHWHPYYMRGQPSAREQFSCGSPGPQRKKILWLNIIPLQELRMRVKTKITTLYRPAVVKWLPTTALLDPLWHLDCVWYVLQITYGPRFFLNLSNVGFIVILVRMYVTNRCCMSMAGAKNYPICLPFHVRRFV